MHNVYIKFQSVWTNFVLEKMPLKLKLKVQFSLLLNLILNLLKKLLINHWISGSKLLEFRLWLLLHFFFSVLMLWDWYFLCSLFSDTFAHFYFEFFKLWSLQILPKKTLLKSQLLPLGHRNTLISPPILGFTKSIFKTRLAVWLKNATA